MKPDILPDENETYRMIKLTQQLLAEAGYAQYEISNFAKPGYECRHNIGYWTRENYLGVGLGAASLIDNVRYSNTRDLYKYIEECSNIYKMSYDPSEPAQLSAPKPEYITNLHASVEPIAKQAQMEEFMFLGLRMTKGVTRARFEECFSMPIEAVYREEIEQLKAEGLLIAREGHIVLTDKGLDLSNYAMAKFLQ